LKIAEMPIMSKSLKMIIEALLYAAEKPLSAKEIRTVLPDAKEPDITEALEVLRDEYESMERSFSLKEVADGYQFRSRSEYAPYIMKMLQKSPSRLSKAAMETLAIIAYKQPILRHEIERFRGVDVGGILRTLLEKGLIKIMGRKDLPGRPLIYGTSKRFLEVFDLKNVSDLPKLKEIGAFGSDEHMLMPQVEENLPGPDQGEPRPINEGARPRTQAAEETLEEAIIEGNRPAED
jgi:segregation and condensation protein B